MAPGYISLAYLIDFRMIKLYLLTGKARIGSISLQSPVTYQLECKTTFEFVMGKNLPILFDIITIWQTSPQFFPSSAAICLLSGLPCSAMGSKVKLLNDNPYRCDSATIIMSFL